jgi:2-dehydropantoate 2-reductase
MKRILIYGMGGIGAYIGAKLAAIAQREKLELTFVARGAHLAAIKANGLCFRGPDGTESIAVPAFATDDTSSVGKVDFVFLCVKGYDLTAACHALVPVIGPETTVVPLLNGADIYERVRGVVKQGIVVPAGIYISSSIAESGLVVHAGGKGNLFLGREPGNASYDGEALRAVLDAAAIPYEWFDDPLPAVWTKYLFIASFGLVTGMSAQPLGGVVADETLAELTRGIQREIAAIAAAKGVALPPDAASTAFEKGKAFPAATKTSFQRDLEVPGKPNEGELFGGTILALGKKLGIPTPTTAKVYETILAK